MRLAELIIRNFGCVGPDGLTVAIDHIVILIGPNNCGKSTILDAYEAFASPGKPLPIARFHHEDATVPVEVEGVFAEVDDQDAEKVGKRWLHARSGVGDKCIVAKWVWAAPGRDGEKFSWNPETGSWDPKGMGGWDSLLISAIPTPIRINPFDDGEKQQKVIVDIFAEAVKGHVGDDEVIKLQERLKELAARIHTEVENDIGQACKAVENELVRVFPGHVVSMKPGAGEPDIGKLIPAGTDIRITDPGGTPIPLANQGAGMKRAFLWSALAALSSRSAKKGKVKKSEGSKKRILLIDEPEAFLHPPAVRKAREALYALAEMDDWQVLASTHSPVFIDVSKPHTTICRIEKESGCARTFRTDEAEFTEPEREQLRMIRACNPFVAEFFFAENVVLVEGETELAVIDKVLEMIGRSSDLHIVNCIGKANIPVFARILNHFGKPYSIIHDSDAPFVKRKGAIIGNGAWKENEKIRNSVAALRPPAAARLFASVPDFEGAYFGTQQESNKPYEALCRMKEEGFGGSDRNKRLACLVEALLDPAQPGHYSTEEDFLSLVDHRIAEDPPENRELWALPRLKAAGA